MSKDNQKLSWSEIHGASTCTPSELVQLVHLMWGSSNTLCVVGEAGIGKTQTMMEAAEQYRLKNNIPEEDFGVLYYVLAHVDREHVTGLYFFDKDGDTFRAMHYHELVEQLKKPHGMYFLDEINRPRDPSLINAVFSMVSERKVNGLQIPDGWAITTAINPASAQYMVANLEKDPAFRRRMLWTELTFNQNQWINWAKKSGKIHKQVLKYLMSDPSRIYDRTMQDKGSIGPTPAGWEDASRLITAFERDAETYGFTKSLLRIALAGKVGQTDTSKFMDVYQQTKPGEELPSPMDIVCRYTEDDKISALIKTLSQGEGVLNQGKKKKKKGGEEQEDTSDLKGYLVKTLEGVVLTAINAEYTDILAGAGHSKEDIDEMSPAERQKKAISLIGANMSEFMADLPPEMFTTITILWKNATDSKGVVDPRVTAIAQLFSRNPNFAKALNAVRDSAKSAVSVNK